jgi:DNA helicase-2/ATP-dependent DNA helicase PcrA
VNAALLPVQLMCCDAEIPSWMPVASSVLERSGTRAALAYLRLANALAAGQKMDGRDLAFAARRPPRSLPPNFLERLGRSTWTLARLRREESWLNGRAAERYDEFLTSLEKLGAAGADSATLLRIVRDEVGLGGALETLDRSGRGPDGSHLDDLNALIAVAPLQPDPAAFESWVRARLPDRAQLVVDDAVALSTVHRVKGMEWPRVIVFGGHDGLMPHTLAENREEERRIFHVALTRGSETVRVLVERGRRTRFVDETRQAGVPEPEPEPVKYLLQPISGPADGTLVAALKAWRSERARKDNVPAYVVLWDSHLERIAERNPRSLLELARCPGIGPTKLERYGDEILAVVENT